MAKIFRGVGALFLLAIMALGVWGIVYNIRFDVPEETISQAFWIPVNAEIRSSQVVQPGTFKTYITLEEFQATTTPDQKVLVVYQTRNPFNKAAVEYFRPNPEIAGTFYYNSTQMPGPPAKPWSNSAFTLWDIGFDEQNATFQYTSRKSNEVLWLSSWLVVFAGFILFASTWIAISNRRTTTYYLAS